MKTKLSLIAFFTLFSVDSFATWTNAGTDLIGSNGNFTECSQANPYKFILTSYYYIYWHSIPDSLGRCNLYKDRYQSSVSCPDGQLPFTIGTQSNVCQVPVICPDGQHDNGANQCIPYTFPYFTGDPDGCRNFGGLYYPDHSCLDPNDWVTRIYKDPDAQLMAGLALGGVLLSPLGLVGAGLGLTTASSAGLFGSLAIHTGVAAGIGLALYLDPNTELASDSAPPPTNAIKIDLDTWKTSDTPDAGGTTVTKTNDPSGKVEKAIIVPDSVIDQISDPTNINPETHEIINPIDTTGMQEIDYNYEENIATVTTHTGPSSTTVTRTGFTTTQNADGTVTTTPNNPIAPTVSGTNGGSTVNYSYDPKTPTPSPTDANSTDGKDYTGVLNSIKTNTASSANSLGIIANAFSTGTFASEGLKDGSDKFGEFDGQVKGSFSGFVYTDPLGISNMGAGQSVPTYSFSLMGQTFVLFDQTLFNKLPLDLIKSILLFVAAVAGFITVISFGA